MFKNKILFLLVIGLQASIIQSMDPNDPNNLNGQMDEDLGTYDLFKQPAVAQASLTDEHSYRAYPEYQEVCTRRSVALAAAVVSPKKEDALKRKFLEESDNNQKSLQVLGDALKQGVVSPEKIISEIKKIKPTPNKTQAAAAGLAVTYMHNGLPGETSPRKRTKMTDTLNKAAKQAPTPLLRNIAPIDVYHTQNGQLVQAGRGPRMFHGGHNAQIAFAQGYLEQNQYVFTDKSNRSIGALIAGDCPKTLGYGFDDNAVEYSVRSAVTIAKNPLRQDFRLSQVLGRGLVGSYQSGFAFATVFPVLWVNGNDLIDGKEHSVARFCQLDQNGRLQSTADPRDIVRLSLLQLHGMMTASTTKLKTGDENVLVADITDSMQAHCTEQLSRLVLRQFPSTIYGIYDKRS